MEFRCRFYQLATSEAKHSGLADAFMLDAFRKLTSTPPAEHRVIANEVMYRIDGLHCGTDIVSGELVQSTRKGRLQKTTVDGERSPALQEHEYFIVRRSAFVYFDELAIMAVESKNGVNDTAITAALKTLLGFKKISASLMKAKHDKEEIRRLDRISKLHFKVTGRDTASPVGVSSSINDAATAANASTIDIGLSAATGESLVADAVMGVVDNLMRRRHRDQKSVSRLMVRGVVVRDEQSRDQLVDLLSGVAEYTVEIGEDDADAELDLKTRTDLLTDGYLEWRERFRPK